MQVTEAGRISGAHLPSKYVRRYVNYTVHYYYGLSFTCVMLAVFVRSPAAYHALKSLNILQLTSWSIFKAYTGALLHKAGAASASIAKQV